MSVYLLQHRVDLGRQMPLGGRPQDDVPRAKDRGDLFSFHFDRARQGVERWREAQRGNQQIEGSPVGGGRYDPLRHYSGHTPRPPVSPASSPVEGAPHVGGIQLSDIAAVYGGSNSPIGAMLQPAPGVSPATGVEAAARGPHHVPAAVPERTQPIVPAPGTEVREGRHGPIGMTNPAMQAYESFDPSQYGSYESAAGAAVEMHEADKAAYGDQMASRMQASSSSAGAWRAAACSIT